MDNSLSDLQNSFQDYILGHSDRAIARVESTASLSAARRLDIYHIAYRLRLVDVLADTYERVALYIGENNFDTAARAFIELNPSFTRNLRDYGTMFPTFLSDHYADDPEIAELAEMDARLRYAFDTTDADALRVSDIATLQPEDWDTIVLALHPTASFQQFKWNTPAIWQNLSNGEAPPSAVSLPQPVSWLFWRKELQPHFRSLTGEEHTALRSISEQRTFGATCELLMESCSELDVTAYVGQWLRTWLNDGVLSRSFARDR